LITVGAAARSATKPLVDEAIDQDSSSTQAADRPFYSGKHHRHGMNLQVISSPDGDILWVSGARPGAVHDLTAARIWGIIRELADAGLIVLADKGYIGAGEHVLTPYRGRNKPASQKAANSAHAKLRAPGERANAQLRPGGSCASSAAAPGALARSPRPSTSFRPGKRGDEYRLAFRTGHAGW
jgi:hypothetical protein